MVSQVRAFRSMSIPQSGLLSQDNSLRFSSGHSGPVLTLSNEAQASLPSARLEWWMQASALLLRWGLLLGMEYVGFNYLFIFPPSYVAF